MFLFFIFFSFLLFFSFSIFPFSFIFSFLSPLPRFLSRFLFWAQSAAHNNIPATTDPSSKSQQQPHNHNNNHNSILQPNPPHNSQFKKQINKTQISDLRSDRTPQTPPTSPKCSNPNSSPSPKCSNPNSSPCPNSNPNQSSRTNTAISGSPLASL
jgi:hypothetical protein